MPPTLAIETRLAQSWPPDQWHDLTLLLAVSGGADSVALLRAMLALKLAGDGRLIVAHVNHHLRGEASDADEHFVADLCHDLQIPCEIGHVDLQSEDRRDDGIESAARSARYAFLQQAASRVGARYVVTAHTADDQVETILHRILRGTGISGLSGMERARPLGPATLLRPLLEFRRSELLQYLEQLSQPYRVDASNSDFRFTRNRIRGQLLPELAAAFNPMVADALLRLGNLAGEVNAVMDRLVDRLYASSVTELRPDGVSIRADRVMGVERYLVRHLLMAVWRRAEWPMQAMGYPQWDLLADMLVPAAQRSPATPHKQVFPGAVLAESIGDALHLTRQRSDRKSP